MPKTIRASVGKAGVNASVDVMTIQYLLNCVPAGDGGPAQELAVDGFIGPLTNAAIARFQQTQLGRSDGRVDPSGQTLPVLQSYDPFPNAPFNPHHQAKGGKMGGKQAGKDWPAPNAKGGGKLGGKWEAGGKGDAGGKWDPGGKWDADGKLGAGRKWPGGKLG